MLTLSHLTAGYGGPHIIEEVHLEVHEGEIVTLIGPNGAGKSTVIKSIFGLTVIKEGEIRFGSQQLRGLKTSEISSFGISYVPQGRSTFQNLTVEENLELGNVRAGSKELEQGMKYVYHKFPRLLERRRQKAKLLSGGEQQMLSIGRALMQKPKLLLLDEPSIGLAPKVVAEVFTKLQEIVKDGTAILMVEQNARMALKISQRGYVLELGRNKFTGEGKVLLNDPRIAEAYLGVKK